MIKRLINRKKPEISVIIPFLNVERYLDECIQSVLNQKEVSLEIIMVDDGSTDGSVSIVKKYMKEHSEIRLMHSNHRGPGGARNLGVKHAKGEFIAFVDADDILVKGIYSRMYKACRSNNAELCICNVARFNSNAKWGSDLHEKAFKDYRPITHITETTALVYDTCSVNKLINKKFFNKNRFRFPEDVVYEDISFNMDVHYKCNKVIMIAETGYLWRVREDNDNLSATQKYYSQKNILDRFKSSEWLINNYCHSDIPIQIREAVQYKLLETDLRIILNSVQHVDKEETRRIFEQVNTFIREKIDSTIIEKMSIIDIQRYDYARKGDIIGYNKLMEYQKRHYKNAPVKEKDKQLLVELPRSIFTVSKRTLNDEFSRMQRRTYIDNVITTREYLEVDAHIYIQRYNMPDFKAQEVEIYLINEETNQILKVQAENKKTEFLTKTYGKVIDAYSGAISHYNYDFTGFSLRIDDKVLGKVHMQNSIRLSVVAKYKDRLFQGTQIIKWYNRSRKIELESKILTMGHRRICVRFGASDELLIEIEDMGTN